MRASVPLLPIEGVYTDKLLCVLVGHVKFFTIYDEWIRTQAMKAKNSAVNTITVIVK